MATQNSTPVSYGNTKKTFRAIFNIYDVETGLVLEEYKVVVKAHDKYRAKLEAIPLASRHVRKIARRADLKRYGATASQLRRADRVMLLHDGIVSWRKFYEFELIDFYEINPDFAEDYNPYWHPYVQEVLADCLY